ncbi:RNA polymerase sigma factor [Streptomyces sp. NPDC001675]
MPVSEHTADAQAAVTAWASALPPAGEAERALRPTPEEAQAIVESPAFHVLLDLEPRLSARLSGKHRLDDQTSQDILAVVRSRWMTLLHRGLTCTQSTARPYLYVIADNAAVDHQRKAWRRREIPTGLADWEAVLPRPEYERSAEDIVATNEMHEELRAKVQSLPHRQRRVIELLFLEDLSIDETADLLGIAPETARRYRWTALKALRNMYAHASPKAGNTPWTAPR